MASASSSSRPPSASWLAHWSSSFERALAVVERLEEHDRVDRALGSVFEEAALDDLERHSEGAAAPAQQLDGCRIEIDRGHVVAGRRERQRQMDPAGAALDDAPRRRTPDALDRRRHGAHVAAEANLDRVGPRVRVGAGGESAPSSLNVSLVRASYVSRPVIALHVRSTHSAYSPDRGSEVGASIAVGAIVHSC